MEPGPSTPNQPAAPYPNLLIPHRAQDGWRQGEVLPSPPAPEMHEGVPPPPVPNAEQMRPPRMNPHRPSDQGEHYPGLRHLQENRHRIFDQQVQQSRERVLRNDIVDGVVNLPQGMAFASPGRYPRRDRCRFCGMANPDHPGRECPQRDIPSPPADHPIVGTVRYMYKESLFAVTIAPDARNWIMDEMPDGLLVTIPDIIVRNYILDGKIISQPAPITGLPKPSEILPYHRQLFGPPRSMFCGDGGRMEQRR